MSELALPLPESLLDALVERVVERLEAHRSPWVNRRQAAEHLGVSVSTLEHDKTVPHHKLGSRVMYHLHELDEYVRSGAGVL